MFEANARRKSRNEREHIKIATGETRRRFRSNETRPQGERPDCLFCDTESRKEHEKILWGRTGRPSASLSASQPSRDARSRREAQKKMLLGCPMGLVLGNDFWPTRGLRRLVGVSIDLFCTATGVC